MKKYYSFGILLLVFTLASGSDRKQQHILQNVFLQTNYGLWKPESQQDIIEYNGEKTVQLAGGIKSLMMKQSHYLSVDSSQIKAGVNISGACLNDTSQMFRDLLNGTAYAATMLDADGKPGSGIEHGNLYWVGNRKECAEADAGKFKGQMCTVMTNYGYSTLNLFLSIGVCLPDSCTETDVYILAYEALANVKVYPRAVSCPEPLKYSSGDIIALVVCGMIGAAVIIGTFADVVYMYTDTQTDKGTIKVRSDSPRNYASIGTVLNQNSNDASERLGLLSNVPVAGIMTVENTRNTCYSVLRKALVSFSLITNTKKLLHTQTASGSLTAINGMRVISMWWVILGHTFVFSVSMMDNMLDFVQVIKRFSFQCILNGTYSVDTFFFMSGLLVAYVTIKKLRDQERINWALFYFHRFWRLTPVYAIAIMIWSTLFKHWIWNSQFSFGFTKVHPSQFDYCHKYWWANILYINNFFPNLGDINKQCMGWGWYLANDMQFYLLSPLFLIFLHRMKFLGHGLLAFTLFGCIVSRIVTADYFGMRLPGINIPLNHTTESYAKSSPLYNKPYTRIAPYLIGIWLGYLLAINNNRVRLGKVKLLIGWCVAIAIGISVIYGLYDYYKDFPTTHMGGKAESYMYIGFSRMAWSLALAWVIFVCAVGHGGAVNSFLSWKVWAPLGRLTYCAYIVHPFVLFYFFTNMEKPLHFTDLVMIQQFLSLLVVSYCVAFILSMTVEAPMLALEKIVFNRR